MVKILQICPAPVGMVAHYGKEKREEIRPIACLAFVETDELMVTGEITTEVRAMVVSGIWDDGNTLVFADDCIDFIAIEHLQNAN